MKKHLALSTLCASLLVLATAPAYATSKLDQLQNLSQTEFNLLAKDFTAAASYKAVAPAEPLGITGFDIGAELTVTHLENSDLWKKAGVDSSSLPLPKLHIHKGLPFGFDLGASVVAVPGSNIKLIGAEGRYAILEGGIAEPALSVRVAGTSLSGVDQLDLSTKSIELTASKGFLNITPYLGVGRVWGDLTPHAGSLKGTSPAASKVFAGVNTNFGLFNVAGEIDRTGDNQSISVKFGFRW